MTAGTATSDVASLSITRTNNNAAVATGVDINHVDTLSAAGFLPLKVRNNATILFSLGKAGETTILSLAGTGSRAVLADANGLLSAPVSDVTLKEHWEQLPYGLETVLAMDLGRYQYKDRAKWGDKFYLGMSFQNMSKIAPEATGRDHFGVGYVDPFEVQPILGRAIQQLHGRLLELETILKERQS